MPRIRTIVSVLVAVFICAIPTVFLGSLFGIPAIRELQVRQSIVVPEGAQYLFDNTRPQSGSYSQRNIYFWSLEQVFDLKEYYQNFTASFVDAGSNDMHWSIAAWNTSDTIEPTGRGIYIHTDLCDYRNVFDCLSITILENNQSSVEFTLQSVFGLEPEKIPSIPSGGTLLVFTYTVPRG